MSGGNSLKLSQGHVLDYCIIIFYYSIIFLFDKVLFLLFCEICSQVACEFLPREAAMLARSSGL